MKKLRVDETTIGKIKEIADFYTKSAEAIKIIESRLYFDQDLDCFLIRGEFISWKVDEFLKYQQKKKKRKLSLKILKKKLASGGIELETIRQSDLIGTELEYSGPTSMKWIEEEMEKNEG